MVQVAFASYLIAIGDVYLILNTLKFLYTLSGTNSNKEYEWTMDLIAVDLPITTPELIGKFVV